MKRSLCLLLVYLNCGVMARSANYRLGSKKNFYGYSDTNDNSWSNSKQESTCFKRGMSFQDKSVDDEIEEELSDINMQKIWNGRKVVYKIDNLPKCTDIKDTGTVKRLINEAAEKWNSVENANVMLVNIDDLESSNGVDINNNNNMSEDEFSNDTEELDELKVENDINDSESDYQGDYEGVDILVSFEPCNHLKYRDKKPNAFIEDYGDECEGVYAHAHFFGDIHFNELMTWSDKVFSEDDLTFNDYIKPNLYSIALHEFGHSLGLRHTHKEEDQNDVMYWDFSGMRKYDRLELSENDISNLQSLYPVKDRCQDKVGICSRNQKEYCNNVQHRPLCAKTCDLCDKCGKGLADDYMKCSDSICDDVNHPMRPFCRKTCKLCDPDTLTGKCTGLPSNISRLVTEEEFPVTHGTPVKVRCEEGYKIDGDDVITCQEGTLFSWQDEEPECELIKETGDNGVCADVRVKNCYKQLKLKPTKLQKKCKKSVWKKSCPLTCGVCKN